MTLVTMRSGIRAKLRRPPFVGTVTFACIFAISALSAGAGNIFDDNWTPPKPVVQPHTAPAQPVPPAPVTNPAAPSPNTQPAPEPTPQAPVRRAVPGKAEQARSRALLKEAFAAQLKDRSVAGRKKLAQALLDEVHKSGENPSDEFVLLGGAIDASKDAGVLGLCFQAADEMGSQYEVDGLSIKIDAALKVNFRGDSPAVADDNTRAALELIGPLLAAEDFSTAARILTAARRAASSDPALASAVQKQSQVVESLRPAHDRMVVSAEKLKASPDDPAANLAVGSYLCFVRGEWEKGLILLTKGSDANLKQLANFELSRPKMADDLIRLADGWWDVALKQPNTIHKSIRPHAVSFYALGLEGVTGLRRTVIERRIAEASADQNASIQTGASLPGSGEGFVNSIGMKFVRIKPGTFMMGSPPTEAGRGDNETLHHVKITKSFLMATTPVTQAQWKAVMGTSPSHLQGDDLPVDTVSWDDSVSFCEKLRAKDGKHYHLPTEAEWEYACRAGTQTAYGGADSLDEIGWYNGNDTGQTHAVAQKKPNAWGLYDMEGNVWQWCADRQGDYPADSVTDPTGPMQGDRRVLRGGSWISDAAHCRSATRNNDAPDRRFLSFGFRVVVDSP